LTTLMLVGLSAPAATINLTGTIRDFKPSYWPGGHPDFESTIGGLQTGAVASILGLDGLPVFTGAGIPGYTTQANFDKWWRDDPSNMKATYGITLDDTGHPGVYTYSSNAFFPIDGQLFGNLPIFHNYDFTYHISTTLGFSGGETLTFTGDDDLWVFINGQLAVDIGGIHPATIQSITLNPGDFGMTAGNNYSFDIFYAERHILDAAFRMDITAPLQNNPQVPEPSTYVLMATGLAAVVAARRVKK
jgi:fibro-slime domain-containing protein